jgi:hypothetical protein
MRISALIFFLLTSLSSCGYYGHKTVIEQGSDTAYLIFTGNVKNVEVQIDDHTLFSPRSSSKNMENDRRYELKSGTHRIKVFRNGELTKDEKFYIGNNETKEINLK